MNTSLPVSFSAIRALYYFVRICVHATWIFLIFMAILTALKPW
ncbi:KleE stable inheritance protein [Sphingobacterium arenae]|uniref:Uncharacterized protein n=1 Tax=Sphingobacterium arenae TaxID=1280598 RepID=A0ABR7Y0F0_9SPHI|nr:hypothetical protein [Sphingobacterium arenae]